MSYNTIEFERSTKENKNYYLDQLRNADVTDIGECRNAYCNGAARWLKIHCKNFKIRTPGYDKQLCSDATKLTTYVIFKMRKLPKEENFQVVIVRVFLLRRGK